MTQNKSNATRSRDHGGPSRGSTKEGVLVLSHGRLGQAHRQRLWGGPKVDGEVRRSPPPPSRAAGVLLAKVTFGVIATQVG